MNPQDALTEFQMAAAAHRQIFCQALHKAQNQCVNVIHDFMGISYSVVLSLFPSFIFSADASANAPFLRGLFTQMPTIISR